MQNEDRQEISDTLKLLIHNNTKCQDMSGKKIYGNIQKVEKKNITGMTYQLSNETGHGEITVYRVFTGIELYYNDMHMEYCNQNQATVKNMIEINHCLIGRFECSFGENSCCYMAEGDLSISSMMKKKSNSCFPLNHYHGISIIINLDELLPEVRRIMELLNIDLHYIQNGSIKAEWTPEELLSMPEAKRKDIGIRAADLRHIEVDIPSRKEKDVTLEVKGLAFSYRKHPVFHDISFQAYAGDLIAIIGHNGIGKTTLSNILCGMQKEKAGQILYSGKDVSKGRRKNFAYFVMQNTDCQLFGDSVEEELLLNGKGSTQEQRDDLLKMYGLFEWKERHPAILSGGQKQRLTLAVSDWIDTPILILDEPTSGLDYKNMVRISEHLKALAQKGKTILIITHDYEFAAMTCNRVLHFIDEGHAETFPLQGSLPRLYSCLMCQ